jgi:hypothetical protein
MQRLGGCTTKMKFNFKIGSKHGKVAQWSSLSRSFFFKDGSCQHKHKNKFNFLKSLIMKTSRLSLNLW